MKFGCEYSLSGGPAQAETGQAEAGLSEEAMTLAPKKGAPLTVPWEAVSAFSLRDHRAEFSFGQAVLSFSALGYKFEDFARHAARLRNERLLKLALAEEPLKASMIEADLVHKGPGGEFSCRCELRVYETSLVAMPETAPFLRLPFRHITGANEAGYAVEITGEGSETWRLSGLGGKFDHFTESLRGQMAALEQFVQKAIGAALPGFSPLAVRALAGRLREGLLVPLAELEKVSPGFSAALEKRICSKRSDSDEYALLKKLSNPARTAFGIKKGLMGKLDGDHYMFLFFAEKPAPAALVEYFRVDAADGEADNKATYVYRVPSGAADAPGGFLSFFNGAMTAVNFRRLPILLSDAALADPKNAVYAGALERVPELLALRRLYAGRAAHSGEGWETAVKALLDFIAANPAPGSRSGAGGEAPEEEE